MALTGTYIGDGIIRWEISGVNPIDFDYFRIETSDGASETSTSTTIYTSGHALGTYVTGDAYGVYGADYHLGSDTVYIPLPPRPIGAPIITHLEALYQNGQHRIRVEWDASDVIGENVRYNVYANGVWKGSTNGTSLTIEVDYEYTVYNIEVYPYNEAGEGYEYGWGSIRTLDVTPPSIDTFSIGNIQQTAAVVSFSASDTGSGVDGYELYLNGALYISGNYASDIITLSPLQPATTYGVLLIVYDKAGNSNYVYDTFTTQEVPVDPPSPLTGLTGQHVGGGTVHISWNPSQGATRYKIWYGSSSSPVVEVFVTETSYTATGLMLNELYVFVVTPYNGDVAGEGASIQISTGSVGPRPSNFTWQYSTIAAGQPAAIDHRDWNNLGARINQFRAYKGLPTLTFVQVSQGDKLYASYFNSFRNAIASMSPPISPPGTKVSGDVVYAADILLLAQSLNSIP